MDLDRLTLHEAGLRQSQAGLAGMHHIGPDTAAASTHGKAGQRQTGGFTGLGRVGEEMRIQIDTFLEPADFH
jgi:hypothetical protein